MDEFSVKGSLFFKHFILDMRIQTFTARLCFESEFFMHGGMNANHEFSTERLMPIRRGNGPFLATYGFPGLDLFLNSKSNTFLQRGKIIPEHETVKRRNNGLISDRVSIGNMVDDIIVFDSEFLHTDKREMISFTYTIFTLPLCTGTVRNGACGFRKWT